MKNIIWTRGYRPWILGGDVNAPVGAEVETLEVELAKGFTGLVAFTPKGLYVVAEKQSGAIVGNSVPQVREDILTGSDTVISQQVQDAIEGKKHVHLLPPSQFWKMYEGEKT